MWSSSLPLSSSAITFCSGCMWLSVSMFVCVCVSQVRTRDLGGYSTTSDFVHAIVANLGHRTVWRCLPNPIPIPDPLYLTHFPPLFLFLTFILIIFWLDTECIFVYFLLLLLPPPTPLNVMYSCTFIFISVFHSMHL